MLAEAITVDVPTLVAIVTFLGMITLRLAQVRAKNDVVLKKIAYGWEYDAPTILRSTSRVILPSLGGFLLSVGICQIVEARERHVPAAAAVKQQEQEALASMPPEWKLFLKVVRDQGGKSTSLTRRIVKEFSSSEPSQITPKQYYLVVQEILRYDWLRDTLPLLTPLVNIDKLFELPEEK